MSGVLTGDPHVRSRRGRGDERIARLGALPGSDTGDGESSSQSNEWSAIWTITREK